MPARVALLGFPGLEPDLLDRYMADGTAPARAELARRGRTFDLENHLDHLVTLELVFAAVEAARSGAAVRLSPVSFPANG